MEYFSAIRPEIKLGAVKKNRYICIVLNSSVPERNYILTESGIQDIDLPIDGQGSISS